MNVPLGEGRATIQKDQSTLEMVAYCNRINGDWGMEYLKTKLQIR